MGVNLDVKRGNRKRQRENGQPGGAGHRLRRPPGQRHQQIALLNNKGGAQHRGRFHRHLPRIALPLQLAVQHPLPLIPRGYHQMTGRKIGVQGQRRAVSLTDDHIFVPQPVDLLKIGMGWLVRGVEPESQVDLARQQLGQRRAMGQITKLKPQPGRLPLQAVHQRRKDAECGEIGDRNLHAVGAGARHKRRRRRQLLIDKFQRRSDRGRQLAGIDAGTHPVAFAIEQRVVEGAAQPGKRMAQRRGAHRQLFRRQAHRAGAIDRVKHRQQVEVNPAQDWMHNIHHLLISLHLILFTIPLMLWVSNVALF